MSDRTNDPWETEMSRAFDQRVRDLHEAPLSLDQVKGKAGKIRRNRRAAVAGGIAAIAAVVVPIVAFGASDLFDSDSSKPPVANHHKTQQHAEDTTGPGFGYIEGRTLHRTDGATVELDADYQWATELGSTVYAVRNDPDTGDQTLDALDQDGTTTASTALAQLPVVSDDHTVIAYVEADGDLVTLSEEGGSGSGSGTPVRPNTYPVAVTDDAVYLEDGTGGPPLVLDPATGETEVAVPGAIGLQDVDERGLLTVMISAQGEGSCGGIYDPATSGYLWQTCAYYLFGTSPDGRYVEATHPYLDGLGHAWTAVLDAATGKELFRVDPQQGVFVTSTWQDSEHLLATYLDGSNRWTVHRIGADGSDEVVLGPEKGADSETSPYVLLDGH